MNEIDILTHPPIFYPARLYPYRRKYLCQVLTQEGVTTDSYLVSQV